MGSSGGDGRRVAGPVWLAMLCALAFGGAEIAAWYGPNTWIVRDGRFYVNANTTIVEHGSLDQRAYCNSWYTRRISWNADMDAGWSNLALGRNGQHYPKHTWLLPLLSTPFFAAFGLAGTLVFNLLVFACVAGLIARFSLAFVRADAAALTGAAFCVATSVREYAYDYHVDVLLLALGTGGFAAVVARRPAVAGMLLAATLVIRPTSLLYVVPAIVLLFSRPGSEPPSPQSARERWLPVVRAAVGGAVVLAVAAVVNTVLFGRPWWTGYNRTIVLVGGVPQVQSAVNAFSTKLAVGLPRLLMGAYGVRHKLTLLAFAVPGMITLYRTRRRYARTVLATSIASIFVFAKYNWEGERFLFLAAMTLAPALALTFDSSERIVDAIERRAILLWRRVRRIPSPTDAPPTVPTARAPVVSLALVFAFAVLAAILAVGAFPAARVGGGPYVLGAHALGRHLSMDVRVVSTAGGVPQPSSPEGAVSSRTRWGGQLPRAPLPAVIFAAPFAAVGGPIGLLALHSVLAGLAAALLARLLAARRLASPVAAVMFCVLALVLPSSRDGLGPSGAEWMAACFAVVAMTLALEQRVLTAGVLTALAGCCGDAWWLALPAVLALVAMSPATGRRDEVVRLAKGLLVGYGAWAAVTLVFFGRPFASPDDFVIAKVAHGVGARSVAVESWRHMVSALVGRAGNARAFVPLLPCTLVGVVVAVRRDPRSGTAIALFTGATLAHALFATRTGTTPWGPLIAVGLGPPLAVFADAVCARLSAATCVVRPRTLAISVAAVLVAMTSIGLANRRRPRGEFRLASDAGIRAAVVHLEELPCDLMDWDHMSWECATVDTETVHTVGLALPEGVTVAGRRVAMMLIPSGRHSEIRYVRWFGIPARENIALRYAIPEGMGDGAQVRVRIDGREIGGFGVDGRAKREIQTVSFATGVRVGRRVTLSIDVRAPLGEAGRATVAIDGEFR